MGEAHAGAAEIFETPRKSLFSDWPEGGLGRFQQQQQAHVMTGVAHIGANKLCTVHIFCGSSHCIGAEAVVA